MRLLLDTNVMLDLILRRQPFIHDAQALWEVLKGEQVVGTGYVSATTVTHIYYIARKEKGRKQAFEAVQLVLNSAQICAVDHQVLQAAASSQGSDFEDNVQIACAERDKPVSSLRVARLLPTSCVYAMGVVRPGEQLVKAVYLLLIAKLLMIYQGSSSHSSLMVR